jgi:hypothetical protein
MALTLADMYELLSTGELAQVIMGNSDIVSNLAEPDGIPTTRRKQLRNAITMGLTDLHTKFLLREESVLIDLASGPGKYYLDTKYAASNTRSSEPVKYLLDTAEPYLGNSLKIARVEDPAVGGLEYHLNIAGRLDSLRTPKMNCIEIPTAFTPLQVKVFYYGDHPKISAALADSAPSTVTIDLPMTHVQALSYYVASRVMNPIGISGEAGFHQGNNYYGKYLAAVQALKDAGMDNIDLGGEDRLRDSGFV